MDTPRTEAFFFHPHRHSAPIDIPQQQRSVSCPSVSSTRTLSPELIFEMEPFSPPTHDDNYSPVPSSINNDRGVQQRLRPLLYPFPVLDLSDSLARVSQSVALPTTSLPPFPIAHNSARKVTVTDSDDSDSSSTPVVRGRVIRPVPVHKVVGFKPDELAGAPATAPPDIRSSSRPTRGRPTAVHRVALVETPPSTPPRERQPLAPVSAPATLDRRLSPATDSNSSRSPHRSRPILARRPSSSSYSGSAPSAAWRLTAYGYGCNDDEVDFAQFLRRRIESRNAMSLTPNSMNISVNFPQTYVCAAR
ncbi:hypothetical protein C8F01DRAFT_541599 [Mycena amicta]|nr:hypothetical protein C8F01DRAFT_541599 [Mycena amicta]